MKKIFKNIFFLILIFILCFVCYSKFIRKDDITKIFGKGFLVVITESMKPTISSGEFIIISEEDRYKVGDVVSYIDEENMIVTHRLEKITKNYFVAKGDNNNISDGEMNIERICGKVVFHSKIIGFFILYLLKPIVILYVIYLVILEIVLINKIKDENKDVIIDEEFENKN